MGQICLRVVVLNEEEIIMVLHLLVHALLLLLHASLLHDVVRLSASGATQHQDYRTYFSKENPRGTHLTSYMYLQEVMRIRDVYPGSQIRIFSIPDPNFFHPGSRIRIKEFKYFNPKKLFLSSRKHDPCCSSRIRILIFNPFRIPDPGDKKAPDPDPQHCLEVLHGTILREWLCHYNLNCTLSHTSFLKGET
jgi:hypothetical protein